MIPILTIVGEKQTKTQPLNHTVIIVSWCNSCQKQSTPLILQDLWMGTAKNVQRTKSTDADMFYTTSSNSHLMCSIADVGPQHQQLNSKHIKNTFFAAVLFCWLPSAIRRSDTQLLAISAKLYKIRQLQLRHYHLISISCIY